MSLLTILFKKFLKNSKVTGKKEASNKSKALDKTNFNGCYKCGKLDYIIKDSTVKN